MLLTNMEPVLYLLNYVIKHGFLACRLPESPYLCTVFFIVLDFKVNKGWSTAVLLFFMSIRFVYQYTIKINPPTDDFLMADFIFVILHSYIVL